MDAFGFRPHVRAVADGGDQFVQERRCGDADQAQAVQLQDCLPAGEQVSR
jgi:hypothetical protein